MKSINEILGRENYTGHFSIKNVFARLLLITLNRSFVKGYQSLNNRNSELISSILDSNNFSSDVDNASSARHKALSVNDKFISEIHKLISEVYICGSVRNILSSAENKFISVYNKPISRCDIDELRSKKLISGHDKSISGPHILISASSMPIYWFKKQCLTTIRLASDSIIVDSGKFKKNMMCIKIRI